MKAQKFGSRAHVCVCTKVCFAPVILCQADLSKYGSGDDLTQRSLENTNTLKVYDVKLFMFGCSAGIDVGIVTFCNLVIMLFFKHIVVYLFCKYKIWSFQSTLV